jgi:hypothetical protein
MNHEYRKTIETRNMVSAQAMRNAAEAMDQPILFWTNTLLPVRGGFVSCFKFSANRRRWRCLQEVTNALRGAHPDWGVSQWKDVVPFGGVIGFTVRTPKPMPWDYLTEETKRLTLPLLG